MNLPLSRSLLVLAIGASLFSLAAIAAPPAGSGEPGARAEHRALRQAERLKQLDSDADGRVSPAEIEAAASRHAAEVDNNRDGRVEIAEIEAFREARRAQARAERQQRMLAKLDADGNGQVSTEEFAAAHAQRLARMDRNGDGVIEAPELARGDSHGDRHGRRRGHRGPSGHGG